MGKIPMKALVALVVLAGLTAAPAAACGDIEMKQRANGGWHVGDDIATAGSSADMYEPVKERATNGWHVGERCTLVIESTYGGSVPVCP